VAKNCCGPTLAKVSTVDSNYVTAVLILALLATGVWSLIALSLFWIGTEDVEIPGGIVWLSVGIIGFSTVLLFFSTYI
jgi:hypothetical protein